MTIKDLGIGSKNWVNPEDAPRQSPQVSFTSFAARRRPVSPAFEPDLTPESMQTPPPRAPGQSLLTHRRTVARMLRAELESIRVLLNHALKRAHGPTHPPA